MTDADLARSVTAAYLEERGNLLKTRRTVIRRWGWRHDEWYRHWPLIAHVLALIIVPRD